MIGKDDTDQKIIKESGKEVQFFDGDDPAVRKIRFPKTFEKTYHVRMQGMTRDNFREFVMPDL